MSENASIASKIANVVRRAFFGSLPRDLVDWRRARFADPGLERDFLQNVVDVELPKDRLINYAGIGIYYLFGILDFLTFDTRLTEVLILRWAVCGPIAIAIVSLSLLPRFKRGFKAGTASVMLIGALSVVAMIGMAPSEGAPPYIIGAFAIFILYACLQRLDFRVATAIYLVSFAAWSLTVTTISPKSEVEVLSGHFFFAWITIVSIATSYSQEIRARLVYFRNRQREEDAIYIQKLLIEATAADRSKINFLSILSHELRTPLHQIIGFSQVLQGNPSDNLQDYLGQINDSAHQLLKRISKMLRYADATAGTIRYEPEQLDAEELLTTLIDQHRENAAKRSVHLVADAIAQATLRVDASHTIYALSNIVENAISASAEGQSIRVSGRVLPGGGYEVLIADAGCGMSADQIKAAFEPFTIAEEVRTRSLEGVGLGLTLANKILTDQRAALTLQSRPGVGTTASIVFPTDSLRAAA